MINGKVRRYQRSKSEAVNHRTDNTMVKRKVRRYQRSKSEAVNHRTDNTMVKWKVRRYQRSKSEAVNHRTDNTMVKWKVGRYQRSKSQDRQYNGQMIKDKRTNNDLQNITQRNKDWATRIQLNSGGELRCSRRVIISCSTRGSLRVNLVANSLNRDINNSTNINKTNNHFSLHLKYGRDTHRW